MPRKWHVESVLKEYHTESLNLDMFVHTHKQRQLECSSGSVMLSAYSREYEVECITQRTYIPGSKYQAECITLSQARLSTSQ